VGNRTSGSFGGTIGTWPTMSGGAPSTFAIASGANQGASRYRRKALDLSVS